MEYCLLCLERNEEIMEGISVNSARWNELDLAKTIERHFWSLNTIHSNSWLCLTCWREVDGFHTFFLRIEEAHLNFAKVKIEDGTLNVECEKEIPIQKFNEDKEVDYNVDNVAYFLETEIKVDKEIQRNSANPEIQHLSDECMLSNETTTNDPLGELDLCNVSLKQVGKRKILLSKAEAEDNLEKSNKSKKTKNVKLKLVPINKSMEESKLELIQLKDEPMDVTGNYNSDSISDIGNDVSYQRSMDLSEASEPKRRTRMENDEFIAKHFKQLRCELCQVPFDDFHAIKRHFSKTHKQPGYVLCCKRKFVDRTRLIDHLHYHLNPDYFKCKECGKAMSDRMGLSNHMLRVHRADEVIKRHSCDICGKSFAKSYVLKIHKLSHLPPEEKKFPCNDCGKNYGSANLLNQHTQAVHLKRFIKICYVCGKGMNSSAEFKVHMNKHEGVPPHISCDICGLRLTSERGLKLHKESQHPVGGKQQHQCSICFKISPTPKALQKHINTMHKKGYNHTCNICEKAFKRTEGLREHMATHTGTALYTCPWCPKTFNSNGNMHAHRKKMHPKEWQQSKLQKYSGNMPPEI